MWWYKTGQRTPATILAKQRLVLLFCAVTAREPAVNFIVRKFIDWKINNCLTRRPEWWNINTTCLQKIFIWRGSLGSGKWGRAHKKMIDLDIIPTFRVWRDPASCGCGDAVTWSARSQEPRVAACRHLPCVCGEIVRAVISVGDVHFFRQERDQVRLRLPTITNHRWAVFL